MSEQDYYPAGAYNNSNAPWNEEETETSVTISITMSKSVKLKHLKDLNLDSYELRRLVEEQVMPSFSEEFESWDLDDLAINLD